MKTTTLWDVMLCGFGKIFSKFTASYSTSTLCENLKSEEEIKGKLNS
jgi:hypothetical protein